ncbi:MAG: Citrate synthase 2 [Elusimicrobia bacterium]|nr:Citrate synthase 2 [Elusimicrobiota bacterium]
MIDTKVNLPDGYKPGLEGIVAGTSSISEVDAQKDALSYRGYPAHDLAEKATYEEVSHLLLKGKLPNKSELTVFQSQLSSERSLSPFIIESLKKCSQKAHPMVLLRYAVELIGIEDVDADKSDVDANLRKALRLVAKTPTVIAALSRLRQGKDPLPPSPNLGHAANFLYMTLGKEQDPEVSKIFDSSNILYGDHGFNASTFAARVTASTLSDLHSSVISAIGALKGPLHGGANEAAIEMLLKIGDISTAEAWIKSALARKEKIMGFGHRVYKRQDSRAPFMKVLAEKMAHRVGDTKLFAMSCRLEDIMKAEKNLFPNVDYHCAVAYYLMGLPIEIYTPIFAMARMSGWTAHILEQYASNRLIRPECIYTGPRNQVLVTIEKRN